MNWGYKLFFTFTVFAALMSFLVYKAVSTDFQLVEKEYYKSELRYQEVIDGTNRVNALSSVVNLTKNKETITLQLPDEMKNRQVEGSIWFYCAYDAAKDKKIELKPDASAKQQIPAAELLPGNYTVKIQWKQADKHYYSEKKFIVE
jgi:nitrogen fixation protein FixH